MNTWSNFAFPVLPLSEEGRNEFFRAKQCRLEDHITNQLNRTLTMFRYKGLPEYMHERDVETIFQTKGHGLLSYEEDGTVRLFTGSFAPPINYLYENTGYIIANPWTKDKDGTYKIVNIAPAEVDLDTYTKGKEGILVRNDPLCWGLIPIFTHYGIMKLENDLTMMIADVNLRQFINMVASDDNTYESAVQMLKDIEAGKQAVIHDEAFGEDGFKGNPITIPANFMTQLIEYSQYIKASEFNEIGINANYNMKRETLTSSETDMNTDMLRPLIDVMLEERKDAFKAFEDFTGGEVKIEVDFGSVWSKYNVSNLTDTSNNAQNDEISDDNVEDDIIVNEEETGAEMDENESVVEESADESDNEEEPKEETKIEETEETEESETPKEEGEALETVENIVEDIKEIVEDITKNEDAESEVE